MDKPAPSAWEENRPEGDADKLEAKIKKDAEWTQFAGKTLSPQRLPTGVRLAGVWTSHLRDQVTKGDAYLYFFPLGETQKAQIWLTDASDDVYTLTVQPLTGKVKVYDESLEVPRE